MLAIGISVSTDPSATSVLTNASLAAGAPRVKKPNPETKTAYATKNTKAYASLPFISVTPTKAYENAIAKMINENSRTLSLLLFSQGLLGVAVVVIFLTFRSS